MIHFVAAVDDWDTRSTHHLQQISIPQQPRHDAVNVARKILHFVADICQSEVRRSPVNEQACPPSCVMATSKETLVRVLVFWKINAEDLPSKALGTSLGYCLASMPKSTSSLSC